MDGDDMEDPADILAEFFDDDEIIAEDLGDIRPDNGIDLNTENDQDDAEGETDKIGAEMILLRKRLQELEDQLAKKKQKTTKSNLQSNCKDLNQLHTKSTASVSNTVVRHESANSNKKNSMSSKPASSLKSPATTLMKNEESKPSSFYSQSKSQPSYLSLSSKASNSSPDEDNDYGKPNRKKRVAHTSKYSKVEVSKMDKKAAKRKLENDTSSLPKKRRQEEDDGNYMKEEYSGLRLMKPLVSAALMDQRMENRKIVKVHKIPTKLNKDNNIDGDWVTIGVIVQKVPPKMGSNGKKFSIWKLSSLECGKENDTILLFLFGDAFQEHWKIQEGMVIALCNASVMPSRDRDSEIAINIDNPKRLMQLGTAKDLGRCKAKRKSDGNICNMVVNKIYGDFCEYHIQRAYKKTRSKRMECQSGYGGPDASKGRHMKKLEKDISSGMYNYGGKTLTWKAPEKKSKKLSLESVLGLNAENKSKKLTLESVLGPNAEKKAKKMIADAVGEGKDSSLAADTGVTGDQSDGIQDEFKQRLRVPTAGSRNLLHHLHKDEEKEANKKGENIVSVTAKDLIKMEKQSLQKQKQLRNKLRNESWKDSSSLTNSMKSVPKFGKGLKSSDNFIEFSDIENTDCMAGKHINKKIVGREKDHPIITKVKKETDKRESSLLEGAKSKLRRVPVSLNSRPVLGRDFDPDDDIEFADFGDTVVTDGLYRPNGSNEYSSNRPTFDDVVKNDSKPSTESIAKKKAAAILRRKGHGTIEAEDPNAVFKKKSPKTKEEIEKRVLKDISTTGDNSSNAGSNEVDNKPRSILADVMGSVDLDSKEGKELLNAKSAHVGAVKQAEAEREERYFNALEKKEACEDKMKSITEIKVQVVCCKRCKYMAESVSSLCIEEKHFTTKVEAVKRFFMCKECKQRTVAYSKKIPTNPCRNCGANNYERTSMYKEKQGPKIAGETLLVRGEERKYINWY